jgi:hypothetical protein
MKTASILVPVFLAILFIPHARALENIAEFTAVATSPHEVRLSWTDEFAEPIDAIVIRVGRTTYPASRTDGQLVFFGNPGHTPHTHIVPDENATYFFAAFAQKNLRYASGAYARAATPARNPILEIADKGKSTDLTVAEIIQDTTVTHALVAGSGIPPDTSLHVLRARYIAHSQSMSNYALNGVRITIRKDGRILAWETDAYPSQTSWGTAHGFPREMTFADIPVVPGDSLEAEIEVWRGDYLHYLSEIVFETYWNIPPGHLAVAPATVPAFVGRMNGPIAPSSVAFALSNTGGLPISFAIAKGGNWFSLSRESGTLDPGAEVPVVLGLDPAAFSLEPGEYPGAIDFFNIANGNGDLGLPVRLEMRHPLGDINHDRTVDLRDAILVLKVLAGHSETGVHADAGLGNGRIGIEDALWILRVAAGK